MLNADQTVPAADGNAIAHVEACIVDEEGNVVPNGEFELSFDWEGAGAVIGVDNGDLRCHEPYKGRRRTSRGGKCLAIVQSKPESGEIRLKASAKGLADGAVSINVET
ncbi:hypothetical protein J2TS6_56930 [Paenibacillus albilobatus]|uniref:Glycoside hydrolase family 2 domain-containing protein n=2 Tax=Paenibacillus TaxID=44249 RepID=A0A919XPU9_9BACL|nr:hypothetical protein [Paenibacillus albilobatus]GIO34552.1 hypothetical protein J2TS6_56930 [Paenibacillus albilobatus]